MTTSLDPSRDPTAGDAPVLGRSVPRRGGRAPTRSFDEAGLMEALQRRYDLGRWASWRRTDEGKSNDSYFIDTDRGPHVLRRSSEVKTVPAALFECALLDHLVAHGYPAPAVVRARDGACLVHLDGLVHMVMRRLEGQPYDAADPRGLALAGRGLGWYHRLVRDLPAEVTAQQVSTLAALRDGRSRLSEVLEVVGPVLSRGTRTSLSEHLDDVAAEVERVGGVFEDRAAELTYLVTHGSYGRTALLTDDAGLRGVVDFDRAVHDFLVLDLAYAVKSFGRPAHGTPGGALVDLDRAEELLRHYSAELPLVGADAELLPWALRLHRLAVVVKKCGNVLTKQSLQQRGTEDAENFAVLVSREVDRLRWLAAHHRELVPAPSTSRCDSAPHPSVPPRQENR